MSDTGPNAAPNAAQVAYWNDRAALTWTELQDRLDRSFAPITALVLDRAAPRPGEAVLDVGCGCGDTTLALARAVSPGGSVLGLDVSHPMAARARDRITAANLPNVRVEVDDAATHPFAPETDLLFSRFGVMFFSDPAAAFANLRQAMRPGARPGARLAFVCWRPMILNRWMAVPFEAAAPLLPPQPTADPAAPGPFAFADAARIRHVLHEAGWGGVSVDPADTEVVIAPPGEHASAVDYALRMGPLGRLLAEQPDTTRTRVRDAVATALAPFAAPHGTALPAAVWLVTARA